MLQSRVYIKAYLDKLTCHHLIANIQSPNKVKQFRGSFYLTEIKQVHSEDDKIIIIDTFEGCLAARHSIL